MQTTHTACNNNWSHNLADQSREWTTYLLLLDTALSKMNFRHQLKCKFYNRATTNDNGLGQNNWIHIQFTHTHAQAHARTHTHTQPFNGPFSGTTQVSRYQKGKPIWILLKQETVSGSGISWAICKCASSSRQTTMPAPHHSVFYRPDALPATQPTASKHWRPILLYTA